MFVWEQDTIELFSVFPTDWSTKYMYIYELPVEDHYIFFSEHKFNQDKFYVGVLIGEDT